MSIIVGVHKGGRAAIAWDTMKSIGSTRSVHSTGPQKVVRVGASFVGSAGYTVYYNLLDHYIGSKKAPSLKDERSIFQFFVRFSRDLRNHYHLVNEQSDAQETSPFLDLGAEFMVVNRHGIFLVKEILSVSRFEKFCAIGSGAPHAEGALQVIYDQSGSADEIAERAVGVALDFDAASGGPVEVMAIAAKRTPRPK